MLLSDECILWTGYVNPSTGYGMRKAVWFGPHPLSAHRAAFILAFGQLEDDVDVHHTCDRRDCVNVAHLQAIDRSEHGRLSMKDVSWNRYARRHALV